MPQHIVIIGATSLIAEHCCRLWAEKPSVFHLVGRNLERLKRLKADLLTRSPQSQIEVAVVDFLNAKAIEDFIQKIPDPIDIALIAQGVLPNQTNAQNNLEECQNVLNINAVSAALFMEAFARRFEQQGKGTLAVIGSVAGDRGRKSNYIYGAAKGLITRYAQGLQHRFAQTNIHVVLIKPGPTATPMTAHLKGRFAPVERVAGSIIKGIANHRPVIYAPGIWALIMLIVRHLPRSLFHKLNI